MVEPNMSLWSGYRLYVSAEVDEINGKCLRGDCGCGCHDDPIKEDIGKVRTHIKLEDETEEGEV
jgi:hypothetical protein